MNAYGIALAGFAMFVMSCTPALALEREAGMAAGPVEPAAGEVTMKCPDCGRAVVLGSHGQPGLTATCPYCGKEICAVEEAEKRLCAGVDLGFFSKYVSRGVTLSDDPVFQPDAWLSYREFTVSVWGNMDTTDINDSDGEFNELDFTVDYSGSWEKVNYSAGGIYYVFPNTGADDTAELYLSACYDILLQPTVTVFYDFLEADGFYGAFGIGHSFDIPLPADAVNAALELSAQAGWGTRNFNEFNAGTSHTAFTDMVITAGFPVTLSENFTIKPTLSYSSALDRTIRTKNEGNDNLVWGVVASGSF